MTWGNNSTADTPSACKEQYLESRLVQGIFATLIVLGIPFNLVTFTSACLASKTSRKHKLAQTLWLSNLLAVPSFLPLKVIRESWSSGSTLCRLSVALKVLWITQVMLALLLLSTNQYLELYKRIRRKTQLQLKVDAKVSVASMWIGSSGIAVYVYFSSSPETCISHFCSLSVTTERYFGYCFMFLIVIIPFICMAFLNFAFHKLALNHIHSVETIDTATVPTRSKIVGDVRGSRVIFRLYYCVLSLYLPTITIELLGYAKQNAGNLGWRASRRAQMVFEIIFCSTAVFLPLVGYMTDTKLQFELKQKIRSLTQSSRAGYVIQYARQAERQAQKDQNRETRHGPVMAVNEFSNISPNGPLATLAKSMSVEENYSNQVYACYNQSTVDGVTAAECRPRIDSIRKMHLQPSKNAKANPSFTEGIVLETSA